jgi:hypothetical protein
VIISFISSGSLEEKKEDPAPFHFVFQPKVSSVGSFVPPPVVDEPKKEKHSDQE